MTGREKREINNCSKVRVIKYNMYIHHLSCTHRKKENKLSSCSLEVVWEIQDIEEEVGPSNTRNSPKEEPTSELGPTICCLELIGLLLAARQGQRWCSRWLSFLERRDPIDGEADAKDHHEPTGCE